MRSPRLRFLLAPPMAALLLVGCGPHVHSIPAIPRSASAVYAHTDEAVAPKKARIRPRGKRGYPNSPPWSGPRSDDHGPWRSTVVL
jgi:hypothetical protein